mmetsp:Transcript_29922/g.43771  ORF Transcript_29922/g.43771 Transcript_29922/m.43771 type:complete len:252 (+) Transcript_29922:182-937(+)
MSSMIGIGKRRTFNFAAHPKVGVKSGIGKRVFVHLYTDLGRRIGSTREYRSTSAAGVWRHIATSIIFDVGVHGSRSVATPLQRLPGSVQRGSRNTRVINQLRWLLRTLPLGLLLHRHRHAAAVAAKWGWWGRGILGWHRGRCSTHPKSHARRSICLRGPGEVRAAHAWGMGADMLETRDLGVCAGNRPITAMMEVAHTRARTASNCGDFDSTAGCSTWFWEGVEGWEKYMCWRRDKFSYSTMARRRARDWC